MRTRSGRDRPFADHRPGRLCFPRPALELMRPHTKTQFAQLLPRGGSVLDVGCWTYSFFKHCKGIGCTELKHYGIDRETPEEAPPPGYSFAPVDVDAQTFPF